MGDKYKTNFCSRCWLVSLFNGISTFLGYSNAKTILEEGRTAMILFKS